MPSGLPDAPPTSRPRRRSSSARIERGPAERTAAWLATGPLGHLYGTVADILAFAARHYGRRAGRRTREEH